MAIRLLPPAPSRNMPADQYVATFNAWIAALPGVTLDMNYMAANLNSIAAGGAYAIPYTWGNVGTVGNVTGGIATHESNGGVNQNAALYLYLDIKSKIGNTVAAELAEFDDATSTIRGKLRLVKENDASKYLMYDVIGPNVSGTHHRAIRVQCTAASSPNPFADGDSIIVFFQRTGDKGDMGSNPIIYVRDDKSPGTPGGATPANGGWFTRTLNSVKHNTIPNASLTNNQVHLEAGVYEFAASAPAYNCDLFRIRLLNNTTNSPLGESSSERSHNGGSTQTRAHMRGVFTLGAAANLIIQQMVSGGPGNPADLGVAYTATGHAEVYAEIMFRKLS